MNPRSLPEAVVFDLDGVLTFTAGLHFAAWKETFDRFLRERAGSEEGGGSFRPFTKDDYRLHVDGRPRYDGVRAFLASRRITLPEENPAEPAGSDTVAALGDRKNRLFRERVQQAGVDVDREAVRLVESLQADGIAVGVASSSRNAELILETCGLGQLFDVRIDGVVSDELGLRGKPAPDIFLAALDRLGDVDAADAVVFEDAVSGVEAGRAGEFGLVVGVARGGQATELRERGAHWVVRDFEGLSAERLRSWFRNREDLRPNALTDWPHLVRAHGGRTPAVFLDYDGTLTPIVDRPDQAELSPDMRQALTRLARACPVTIVSGRGRDDVEALVGIPGINYAGSHGFDVSAPGAGDLHLEGTEELVPVVSAAADEIRRRTSRIPGVLVEDKTYAVAVHYRLVDSGLVPEVERVVDEALDSRPELRKTGGKKVFELRPVMEWDKGRAVRWLLGALDLDRADVWAIYIGDDITDEDAFRALEEDGTGILVAELPRPTAACYSLQDVVEVRELLNRIAEWVEEGQK
ncbi:MAG: trehalose-phosphatase [Candidatus Longimicrobiales bacterium M2_2A_002]